MITLAITLSRTPAQRPPAKPPPLSTDRTPTRALPRRAPRLHMVAFHELALGAAHLLFKLELVL